MLMRDDAIIIGGSFAGLSAAMYLARGRRTVRIVDAGR
jgi:thioredoxin reductase